MYMDIIKIVFVGILGLLLGSFVNAWVWRLSQQIDEEGQPKKLTAKQKKALSIATARSMCPHCKHTLQAIDLVPVFSWLALRGKCRYCHKPISKQYPVVELITAAVFAISAYYWVFGETWQYVGFATWLAVLVGLVALAIYDIKYGLLPDKINYKMYAIAAAGLVIQFVVGRPLSDWTQVLSSLLICSGIFWVIYQVSKGTWIGGGDVKLGFLLGLVIVSTADSLLMLFIASLLATCVTLPLMYVKRLNIKTRVPFGPFLIAATYIAVLFGQSIIDWYQSFILSIIV